MADEEVTVLTESDQPDPVPAPGGDLLSVSNLCVEIIAGERVIQPISNVSLRLHRGETLGVVGESGSGKSMTGLSVMGMLPSGGRITAGSIRFDGRELAGLSAADYRQIRGNEIAMVFQDSMTALNPTKTIGYQVAEPVRLHRGVSKRAARRRAEEVLAMVGLPHPAERMEDYPHHLSGGMQQRVMVAMALACEPRLVIADEPTTALDVTIQAQILELLDDLRARLGMAMLLITHDMGVIAGHADRVAVMYAGQVAETGTTHQLFTGMRHRYTRALLAAIPTLSHDRRRNLYSIPGEPPDLTDPPPGCRFAPRCSAATDQCSHDPVVVTEPGEHAFACWHPASSPPGRVGDYGWRPPSSAPAPAGAAAPALSVRQLVKEYPVAGLALFSSRATVKAVSDVSFDVAAGETFGLVGESGCGKSTLGRLIVALDRPDSGEVLIDGSSVTSSRRELRNRRTHLQMMFQDPLASLDPRMRIGAIVGEPLVIRGTEGRAGRARRVCELLNQVGLGTTILDRHPHELSGGQRQRVGLARALAMEPRILVADEPVSALDASIRSQVLNLMRRTQREFSLTSIVISHDLAVVKYLADRIGVMYLGKLVELGASSAVYAAPAHPYTAGLLAAIPEPDPGSQRARSRDVVPGELPSAISPPSGCRFRTRCPLAQARCAESEPALEPVNSGQLVACHFPLVPKSAAGPTTVSRI
jgi:peptide/nickel transport system ATP-binding protein